MSIKKVLAFAAAAVGSLFIKKVFSYDNNGDRIIDNEQQCESDCSDELTANGISQREFKDIVEDVISQYSEIKSADIGNGFVSCMVRSRSGKSSWQFKLYFMDSGEINGDWSYWCGMSGTTLPSRVANKISNRILEVL